jgi:hypothetical protein
MELARVATWLAAFGLLAACATAEDWPGIEKAGLRHNASDVDVPPAGLTRRWQRRFAPLPIGDQSGPNNPRNFAAGKGAQNLCLVDGRLCLVATEDANVANERTDYYLTVLNAADGRTVNWIRIKASEGNTRAYRWPHACVSASGDNLCGIVRTGWDPETKILFCSQGAYQSSYTAWRPLANAASYEPGRVQDGVAAYGELAAKHAGYQGAFGRTRGEMRTVFGPDRFIEGMQPYTWGLAAQYVSPEAEAAAKAEAARKGRKGWKVPYDTDFETLFGRQGSSYYNTASRFDFDVSGPLLVMTKGAGWGHNAGGDAYVFSKVTGMKMTPAWPYPGGEPLRCFSTGGAIVGGGRLFCAGPAEGRMGVDRPEGRVPKLDQGLNVWAYDVTLGDEKPNDGFPSTPDTARLNRAFLYSFRSRFTPEAEDLESFGQSYYECDGFYRNKAMLIDAGGPGAASLWIAWKPSRADAVELIHAADEGAGTYDLGIGKGLKGVDLWPKISLSTSNGRKYITYFTGYARHRRRFKAEDVEEALKAMHGEEGYANLGKAEIERTRRENANAGMWEGELRPPRGPAELAVFDVTAGRVRWSYNVSAAHPSLPANEFWTYLDKTAMVVAGRWAWLGWVDVSGEAARLRLVAFDITGENPAPVETAIDLGFASEGNGKSALFDLIAADGRLYALVTQSDRLWVRDPRWKAQHVIAIGTPEK